MQERFIKNKIPVDRNITHEEILEELRRMTYEEILAIPITGEFKGMFETFEEMAKFLPEENVGGSFKRSKAVSDKMGSKNKPFSK